MTTENQVTAGLVGSGDLLGSLASATEKIVIYRSQYEQMNDQFWFDNPEYIVGAIGFLVGVLVIYGFVSLIQHLRRR